MRLAVLCYFMAGCQLLQPTGPKSCAIQTWAARFYVGDSTRLGVAESTLSPVVSCSSPEFNHMVCMSMEDYTSLMQYFVKVACLEE